MSAHDISRDMSRDMQCTNQNREMKCREAKALFSPYLDGAVTGMQMHALQTHLSGCADCNSQYQSLCQSQKLLLHVGRPKAPADLGLKLRLAISREVAQAKEPPLQGWMVRFENACKAFMVPATAGFLSAVVIFGIVMGYFVVPAPVQASEDVPLVMVNTAPELQQTVFNSLSIDADSLVIEADVDANGRVQDYRILSDSSDQHLLPQVKQMLIFTTFRPAFSMGRPTPGRAVLSFSKISVRG
jgi:Putative zinc-finger